MCRNKRAHVQESFVGGTVSFLSWRDVESEDDGKKVWGKKKVKSKQRKGHHLK